MVAFVTLVVQPIKGDALDNKNNIALTESRIFEHQKDGHPNRVLERVDLNEAASLERDRALARELDNIRELVNEIDQYGSRRWNGTAEARE